MKRYLGIVLAAMFVFGFAASAFAIHAEIPAETQAAVAKGTTHVTLGGYLHFRGDFRNNTDVDSNNEEGDNYSTYDARVRLRFQAEVSKNTMAVIQLESGTNTSGDYVWGDGTSFGSDGGMLASGNSKRGNLFIQEAWIQHKGSGLLGVSAGFKVGHMPVKLGDGLFYNHTRFGDDAIYLWVNPVKEMELGLMGVKLSEGTTTAADDSDMYTLLLTYKIGKSSSIGFDVSLLDQKRVSIDTSGAVVTTLAPNHRGTDLWNFGLRGKTEVAGLGIRANVEVQSGKTDLETANDIKQKGYAYLVGLDYKLDPVNLTLEYAYGSGDNNTGDTKNNTFMTSLQALPKTFGTSQFTYVYDYRVATAQGATSTGLANTTYAKLGLNADITKALNADLGLYLLQASKKKIVSVGGVNTKGDSKKIGTELDATITYNIEKNLKYFVEAGYLWTGAFYDRATVAADDAYIVRHGISLSF